MWTQCLGRETPTFVLASARSPMGHLKTTPSFVAGVTLRSLLGAHQGWDKGLGSSAYWIHYNSPLSCSALIPTHFLLLHWLALCCWQCVALQLLLSCSCCQKRACHAPGSTVYWHNQGEGLGHYGLMYIIQSIIHLLLR